MKDQQDDSTRLLDTVVPLFNDFMKRMSDSRRDALRIYEQFQSTQHDVDEDDKNRAQLHENVLRQQFFAVRESFSLFEPALKKLARQVSQQLQHNPRMDKVNRIQLEARLAAFENEIRLTSRFMDSFIL